MRHVYNNLSRILEADTIVKYPYCRVHRREVIGMGTHIDKSFSQGVQLGFVIWCKAIRPWRERRRIHVKSQALEDSLVAIPDIVQLRKPIREPYRRITVRIPRDFDVIHPKVIRKCTYHLIFAKHQ